MGDRGPAAGERLPDLSTQGPQPREQRQRGPSNLSILHPLSYRGRWTERRVKRCPGQPAAGATTQRGFNRVPQTMSNSRRPRHL